MTLPIDTDHRRADAYRRRAIELAEEARNEEDRGRRSFLLDKSPERRRRSRCHRAGAATAAGNFSQAVMQRPRRCSTRPREWRH
jgi:hypothetical protein